MNEVDILADRCIWFDIEIVREHNFKCEKSAVEYRLNDSEYKILWIRFEKKTMDLSAFSFPAVNWGIYGPDYMGKCVISFYEPGKDFRDSVIYIVDIEQ